MSLPRRLVSMLAVAGMLFSTSCAGAPAETQVTQNAFTYVEKDITPSGLSGAILALRTRDTVIDVVSLSDVGYSRFRSDNKGLDWDEMPMEWTAGFLEATGKIIAGTPLSKLNASMDMGTDGALYFSYINYDDTGQPVDSHIARCAPDGTIENLLAMTMAEDGCVAGKLTLFGENEDLLLVQPWAVSYTDGSYSMRENGYLVFDLSKLEILGQSTNENSFEVIPHKDMIYLRDRVSNSFTAVDARGGSSISANTLSPAIYQQLKGDRLGSTLLFVGSDETWYFADNDGLRCARPGMETPVVLAAGNTYSFTAPGTYLGYAAALANGDIVLGVGENAKADRVVLYTDEKISAPESFERLEIFSLYDSPILQLAVREFVRQNPGVEVVFEPVYAHEGNTVKTFDDVLQELNTRIVAGLGPDLLVLDGLPWQSYARQGALADMAGVVKAADTIDSVFSPLYDDGLYVVPGRFTIQMLWGYPEEINALATFDDVLENVITSGSRPYIDFGTIEKLVSVLYETGADYVLDPYTGFDEQNLSAFMVAVKSLAEAESIKPDNGEYNEYAMIFMTGMNPGIPVTLHRFLIQEATVGLGAWENMAMFYVLGVENESVSTTADVVAKPFPGLTAGTYSPKVLVGINAGTEKKDLAESFVQCMLSPQVQQSDTAEGLPVTKSGMEAFVGGFERKVIYEEADTPAVSIDVEALLASLESPICTNAYVLSVLTEYSIQYCANELELADAVYGVIHDTELYFAEMQ